MKDTIAAEHFTLTPSIREHILANVARIREHGPRILSVQVFVGEPAPKTFSALIRVHVSGRDLVSRETGEDLYAAVNTARERMIRQLDDHNRRKVDALKRNANRHMIAAG